MNVLKWDDVCSLTNPDAAEKGRTDIKNPPENPFVIRTHFLAAPDS